MHPEHCLVLIIEPVWNSPAWQLPVALTLCVQQEQAGEEHKERGPHQRTKAVSTTALAQQFGGSHKNAHDGKSKVLPIDPRHLGMNEGMKRQQQT